MDKNNLDKIFTDNEKEITLTEYQMSACEQFRKNVLNSEHHIKLAPRRNTTIEKMAWDYYIGLAFEIAAWRYLKNELHIAGLNKPDTTSRTEAQALDIGHNADFSNGELNFNCKSYDWYAFNRGVPESYTFQKSSLNAKSPDSEYLICGVVQQNQVRIRAVLGMERVKPLLLPPQKAIHLEKKLCLYASSLAELKAAA